MQIGLYLLTQFPAAADHAQKYSSVIEHAKLAEELGYDSIWMGDHHVSEEAHMPALQTLMGFALSTKKIRFGSCILQLPLYHPLHVAEAFSMIDVVSDGRLVAGVAIGFRRQEFDAFEANYQKRASILEEQVEIIKKLWTEREVTFQGKFYKLNHVTMALKPKQKPRPPIWFGVGGSSQESGLKRAAIFGDAWIGDPIVALPKLRKQFEIYKACLAEAKKNFATLEVPLFRETIVAPTEQEAESIASKYVIKKYLEYLKWGLPALKEDFPSGQVSFQELRSQRFIIGTPSQVIEEINHYSKELGVNHLILRLQQKEMPEQIATNQMKIMAESVLPHFKSK
jgi:alkanesulfonate monooxygenase SsuD/methylene tetrahydromethanopterin reductase-like flavin-dependent oxidoreductase (luciferase family)